MADIGMAKGAEERGHARAALDADSVREAYRRWAGVYDTVFGGVSGFGRRRAVAAVNRLAGPRVLEVGVGTGLALPLYRRDLQVVGIDLSRHMLEIAKQRVETEKLSNVRGLLEMEAERERRVGRQRCRDLRRGNRGGVLGRERCCPGARGEHQGRDRRARMHDSERHPGGEGTAWRERVGIEPTGAAGGASIAVLKTGRTTRPDPPPWTASCVGQDGV